MDMEKLTDEVERLVKIMESLRGPEGCPWDKEQDYYSLKQYILEEAYEVVETLLERDIGSLKNELGDLLLQVVFQAQIAREQGDFDLIDVISAINEKLIRRHPHVFADKKVDNIDDVMNNWEDIKKKEQGNDKKSSSILEGVSRGMPALIQSYQIQKKAAKVGFDWDNTDDVIKKIKEETEEVEEAIKENDIKKIKNELGDLLFSVVNLSRFYRVNPELELLNCVLKFKKRFKYIEETVRKKGFKIEELTIKELDEFWEEAKIQINQGGK